MKLDHSWSKDSINTITDLIRNDEVSRLYAQVEIESQLSRASSLSRPEEGAVDASVYFPPEVTRGKNFILHICIHLPFQKNLAVLSVKEIDDSATIRGTYSLPLDIPIGTRIDMHLDIPTISVDEPDASVIWRGNLAMTQFECSVQTTAPYGETIGRVRFAVAGVPVGTMRFSINIIKKITTKKTGSVEAIITRYRTAFASYSSSDRAEVLRRVQMLKIAGITVFQDALDLTPGQRWEHELYKEIKECDVFLLFWSSSASSSEWVAKEIDYALECNGGDETRKPAIQPVPIEGPPPTPPPQKLRHLHFNDALLAHIAAASKAAVSSAQRASDSDLRPS